MLLVQVWCCLPSDLMCEGAVPFAQYHIVQYITRSLLEEWITASLVAKPNLYLRILIPHPGHHSIPLNLISRFIRKQYKHVTQQNKAGAEYDMYQLSTYSEVGSIYSTSLHVAEYWRPWLTKGTTWTAPLRLGSRTGRSIHSNRLSKCPQRPRTWLVDLP